MHRNEIVDEECESTDNRLSSGTMVRNAPSLHASCLPDITDLHISFEAPDLDQSVTHIRVQVRNIKL